MSEEIFSKLDKVFVARQERQEAADKAKAEREANIATMTAAFVEKRKTVIRPAMEEIGAYLKSKGHSFSIKQETYTQNDYKDNSITFVFIPEGYSEHSVRPSALPSFGIRAAPNSDQISFSKSTMLGSGGGVSSGDGHSTLDALSGDLIKEKIATLITEVFSRR